MSNVTVTKLRICLAVLVVLGLAATMSPFAVSTAVAEAVTSDGQLGTATADVDGGSVDRTAESGAFQLEYRPSLQTVHIGSFFVLTVSAGVLGYWILSTRRTRGGDVFGVTLLGTSLRTASDVVHGVLGELWTVQSSLLGINLLLELSVLCAFCWFAARYAGETRLTGRRGTYVMGGLVALATLVVATNPIHSLVFAEFIHVSSPFAAVGFEAGPLWWLFQSLHVGLLLTGAGLLARSFTVTEDPSWWAATTLAMAICLALLVGGSSVLGYGPLPHYDYTAVAIAGFALLAAITLLAHGLRRIELTARESVLQEMDDAIVVLDDTHSVVDANVAARTLLSELELGVEFDDLLARPLSLPGANETSTTEVSSEDFVGSQRIEGSGIEESGHLRTRQRVDDPASQRHYLAQATSVTTATNDTIGYTIRFVDVTDLRHQTIELSRKNEQLDRFAGTVTHDLRNPLTVATGYVELLTDASRSSTREDPLDREAASTYLDHVEASLERMRVIIEDILTLARGEEVVTDQRSLSYDRLVRSAWDGVETGRATLTIESGGGIEADRDRTRRLLENLFRNAVEHGSTTRSSTGAREDATEHAGSAVSVVTGLTDDGFYVADDGPGVPIAERESIFEHAYSGDSGGTGLGLSIVQQLATAHGWEVSVTDGPDGGARFEFTGCTTVETTASDAPLE